ncbi:hypothetical protein O4J56_17205 [Nocardiopsis sp. RSe5-2]|uniref:Uncharacterized protein n=1 Tax=Nocardiopsis endophytica TaxID=3018445 RepID=A0ABT4U608_9ACTN|nr:hypothetical protein [Nocardiopsis endophytica]MDA2812383.1 hypothetical protein [Nocardiopsis endophytica]
MSPARRFPDRLGPARRAGAALAGAALALALSPAPAQAQTYPGFTVSRYVPLSGSESDISGARAAGCAEGEGGRSGPRVLFFGTQEAGGDLRQPGTSAGSRTPRVRADRAVQAAEAWADGFEECASGGAEAELALGVNNKSDGKASGSGAGSAWADVVDRAAARISGGRVSVAGAVDAEPEWSSASWARAWVDAYTSGSSTRLYAANSAGGCPQYGSSSTGCNNGWRLSDVHYVSSGASDRIQAVPQIYRTDGIQARQWAAVSAWGADRGKGPVRFAGSMSQRIACKQRGGCERTDNTAKAAWTQLREELNAHPETRIGDLPYATDVRWP